MMSYCRKAGPVTPQVSGFDAKMLEQLIARLVDSALGVQCQQNTTSLGFCCVPTGCKLYLESPTRFDEFTDTVRVICSNSQCSAGRWMHFGCFKDWEQLMEICLRSRGPEKEWKYAAERNRGLEMALAACSCICGKGYIRKDIAYYVANPNPTLKRAKVPHQSLQRYQHQQQTMMMRHPEDDCNRKCYLRAGTSDVEKCAGNSTSRDQPFEVRVRTFSFSSTGSSPTSSNATPPPISPRRSDGGNYLSTPSLSPTPIQEAPSQPSRTTYGNIFRHRSDLSAFRVLPRTVQNPYHIKVEDDGPHGNDKIRGFLMMNLTRNHITEVHCSVCSSTLPVFDEFPLIDGTFFLSPRHYADQISVVFERRMVYLNAICLGCLDGSKAQMVCQKCLTPWDGSSLILGTMYSYDVFGAMTCCRSRISCLGCGISLEDPQNLRFFSDYSRLVRCSHCELEDYHFLRPLKEIFFFKTV